MNDKAYLPYGRHHVDDDDIAAVIDVLRSDWLTTGPKIPELEKTATDFLGCAECVAVSSGTAALHAIAAMLGLAPGDEVIVPAITFVATANAVVHQGGVPRFADVDPTTLLIDPRSVERLIGPRTRAIIGVDYAGQPVDCAEIAGLSRRHGLRHVSDACHALGAVYAGKSVATVCEMSAFSLHPVKHITAGEGGLIATNDAGIAKRLRRFRNHGIATDHRERQQHGVHSYEMVDLGFNYRLNDLQAALACSQFRKLPSWLRRRRALAHLYDSAISIPEIKPLSLRDNVQHAYHLYVVRIDLAGINCTRDQVFSEMRDLNIGVNVHYSPVHLHPFYRDRFGTAPGQCPEAERSSLEILTLPLFPDMTERDVDRVVSSLEGIIRRYRR